MISRTTLLFQKIMAELRRLAPHRCARCGKRVWRAMFYVGEKVACTPECVVGLRYKNSKIRSGDRS